jgi:hypothetical protein
MRQNVSKIRQLIEVLQCTVYWSHHIEGQGILDLTDLGQEAHENGKYYH